MTARPSTEELLVRELVGTRRRRTDRQQRIRSLAMSSSTERLAGVAVRQRLGGVLPARLAEAGADAGASELDRALEPQRRHDTERLRYLERLTFGVISALSASGVTAVALKGPQLGEDLYGQAAFRPSSDVDVLVHPRDLVTAVAALEGLGFPPPPDPVDRRGRPELHFRFVPPAGAVVELHWRLHWYDDGHAETLLATTTTMRGGLSSLGPAATLAGCLLFYARDGFVGLRQAADVSAWWDAHGASAAEPSPPVLDDLIRRHPQLGRTLHVAARLSEEVTGVPAWRMVGRGSPSDDRRTRLIAGFHDWRLHKAPQQRSAEVALVDALLTPPGGRWALVRRQFVPSRARLRFQGLIGDETSSASALLAQARYGPPRVARWVWALI